MEVEVCGEGGEHDAGEEREKAGGDVVEHDAGACGDGFELADGPGFEDVEETEEEEIEGGVAPVWGCEDEGEELAGDFVDDDEARVLAGGFARGDGGGGDADERDENGGEGGGKDERGARGGEGVGGGVPEEDGEDAAVCAGAWLQVAGTEEGGKGPGPAGLAEGGHYEILRGELVCVSCAT